MSELPGVPQFEYLPQIPATENDAQRIQTLTLQDMIAGGFENPLATANPNDDEKKETQLTNLTQYPEKYSGYRQENGLIVAYMKTAEWLRGDEAPFAANAFAKAAFRLKKGSMEPKAYGILGLVVDQSLEKSAQLELLHDLAYRSFGQAALHAAKVVNVIVHEKDPALEIIDSLGFKPVGPKGEAVGAPGLLQQRFQAVIE